MISIRDRQLRTSLTWLPNKVRDAWHHRRVLFLDFRVKLSTCQAFSIREQTFFAKLKLIKFKLCAPRHRFLSYITRVELVRFPQVSNSHILSFISYLFLLRQLSTTMPKRQRSPEEPEEPDRSSWPTVDLLEFIRPAILAMLFFMYLMDGLSNLALVTLVLNGQGRLMVRLFLLFLFVLILIFLNISADLTTWSSTRTACTCCQAGSTNFDNGTSTCSTCWRNFVKKRRSSRVVVGLSSHITTANNWIPGSRFHKHPFWCPFPRNIEVAFQNSARLSTNRPPHLQLLGKNYWTSFLGLLGAPNVFEPWVSPF